MASDRLLGLARGSRRGRAPARGAVRTGAALLLVLAASGCANVGYYMQTVSGQFDIWRRERPIEAVLQDPEAPAALKEKLAKVKEIREFAVRELGLPDNNSYRGYADLGRRYVVWNVFATDEFSVEPKKWCFLFAGCVSYRGYFSREEAEKAAHRLAAEGHEVFVGGVPAYSTLGWFADPVLSTFIWYREPDLARLLFHELSHQVVYVRDDSTFNESFAVAVEREGMRRWLDRYATAEVRERYERGRERQRRFIELLIEYRAKLRALYATGYPPAEMRERKKAVFDELQEDYKQLRAELGPHAVYDEWIAKQPNNAMLATAAIYTRYVPAFETILRREGGDLTRFYAAVKGLAGLSREERIARLETMIDGAVARK